MSRSLIATVTRESFNFTSTWATSRLTFFSVKSAWAFSTATLALVAAATDCDGVAFLLIDQVGADGVTAGQDLVAGETLLLAVARGLGGNQLGLSLEDATLGHFLLSLGFLDLDLSQVQFLLALLNHALLLGHVQLQIRRVDLDEQFPLADMLPDLLVDVMHPAGGASPQFRFQEGLDGGELRTVTLNVGSSRGLIVLTVSRFSPTGSDACPAETSKGCQGQPEMAMNPAPPAISSSRTETQRIRRRHAREGVCRMYAISTII